MTIVLRKKIKKRIVCNNKLYESKSDKIKSVKMMSGMFITDLFTLQLFKPR